MGALRGYLVQLFNVFGAIDNMHEVVMVVVLEHLLKAAFAIDLHLQIQPGLLMNKTIGALCTFLIKLIIKLGAFPSALRINEASMN